MSIGWCRCRMSSTTPEYGSPVLKRTSRMSPGLTRSTFSGEKRRVRAPEGSSAAIWSAVTCLIGSRQILAVDRGAGSTRMRRRPSSNPEGHVSAKQAYFLETILTILPGRL